MDIQQLNAIGNTIAQTVKSQWGFDNVRFVAGRNAPNKHFWAFCLFSLRGANAAPYTIPREEVDWLLALSEAEAEKRLRGMIEGQARHILNKAGHRRLKSKSQEA
jgi:hypothetical protein